jgi:AcrR family transcriptional regulator
MAGRLLYNIVSGVPYKIVNPCGTKCAKIVPVKAAKKAPDVRSAILDAAERRLREAGPGAIRLQEVAAEVGISHPAVLHHFGSREGLVQAVVERAIRALQDDLARTIARQMGEGRPDGEVLFERVFEVLFDRGHARLLAWLLLAGYEPFDSDAVRAGWASIVEMTHAMRLAGPGSRGKKSGPSLEDTRFTVLLSALALFGEAIAGRATFDAAGVGRGAPVERRFRRWLAELVGRHLAAHRRDQRLVTSRGSRRGRVWRRTATNRGILPRRSVLACRR